MSLLKINRGKESDLPENYNDGWIYFCTDTGSFLIDHENPFDNTIIRTKINAEHTDKIYYTQNEEPPDNVPDGTLWIAMDEEISEDQKYEYITEEYAKVIINNLLNEAKESGDFTPKKHIDYWTEEDQLEIVNAVLIALPSAEEVGF